MAEQPKEGSATVNRDETIGLASERVRAELLAIGGDRRLEELEKSLTGRYLQDGDDLEVDRSQAGIPARFKIGEKTISVFFPPLPSLARCRIWRWQI